MTGRMINTAKHYLEGDSKGNLSKSMRKAGYSLSYANTRCDYMYRNVEFEKALEAQRPIVEANTKDRIQQIDDNFTALQLRAEKAKDRTTEARCIENKAKHRGYYLEDNKQKSEQIVLDERKRVEAVRLANIRCLNLDSPSQAVG